MVGKQNNKRFISHGTPLKYDFLMFFFLYLVLILLLSFSFFCYHSPICLSAVYRRQGGIKEMQIIEINKIEDLWI